MIEHILKKEKIRKLYNISRFTENSGKLVALYICIYRFTNKDVGCEREIPSINVLNWALKERN